MISRSMDWAGIYGERELYKAAIRLYTKPLFNWRKALSTSHDEQTLHDFARHGLKNLARLHCQLREHRFHFRPGLALHHNFNGKHRTLYVYPWEERLVDLLLYRLLSARLNAWFSPHSYAYRLNGWGVDNCQRRVARAVKHTDKPAYIIKRDITDYFGSVDHEILLSKLSGLVRPDDYLFALLTERVRFPFYDRGQLVIASRGIPFGAAIACVFANIYLTELDRRLADIPGLAFFRYADDLLVITASRPAAMEAAARIDDELAALRLRNKPSHRFDILLSTRSAEDPIFHPTGKFRFLGLEFRASGIIGLSRDKSRKIRNLFRYAFRRRSGGFRRIKDVGKRARFAIEIARKVIDDGLRNVAIIDYYLKHVEDESQLRLIDRWLAEEVLAIACGNGHKKGHFRTLGFRELKAMGLPSLVHRRRLIRHRHVASPFFIWKNRNGSLGPGTRAARPRPEQQRSEGRAFSPFPEAAAEKRP